MEDANQKQQKRIKCPKGMKLPRSIKIQAALMRDDAPGARNSFMRKMGIVIHQAAIWAKSSGRDRKLAASGNTDAPAAE